MIIETKTDPLAQFLEEKADDIQYTFETPIVIVVERIASVRPGFYRHPGRTHQGSIISLGGPDFGIEYSFAKLRELMHQVHSK